MTLSQVIQKVWVEKPVEDFGWNVCLHFKKDGNVYFYSQHRLDLDESLDLLQDEYENEVVKFCVENDLYWEIVE